MREYGATGVCMVQKLKHLEIQQLCLCVKFFVNYQRTAHVLWLLVRTSWKLFAFYGTLTLNGSEAPSFLVFKVEIRPDYRGLLIIIAPQYSRNFKPYFFRRGCGLEGLGTLDSSNNLKGTHFRRHPYCTIWPLEFPPQTLTELSWCLDQGAASHCHVANGIFLWNGNKTRLIWLKDIFTEPIAKLKPFENFCLDGKNNFVLKPFKIFIRLGEQH